MNVIAGAAITFKKAAEPRFVDYARATLSNSRALATALLAEGVTLITGGTDNHLLVIDTMASFGLDGRPFLQLRSSRRKSHAVALSPIKRHSALQRPL